MEDYFLGLKKNYEYLYLTNFLCVFYPTFYTTVKLR